MRVAFVVQFCLPVIKIGTHEAWIDYDEETSAPRWDFEHKSSLLLNFLTDFQDYVTAGK